MVPWWRAVRLTDCASAAGISPLPHKRNSSFSGARAPACVRALTPEGPPAASAGLGGCVTRLTPQDPAQLVERSSMTFGIDECAALLNEILKSSPHQRKRKSQRLHRVLSPYVWVSWLKAGDFNGTGPGAPFILVRATNTNSNGALGSVAGPENVLGGADLLAEFFTSHLG